MAGQVELISDGEGLAVLGRPEDVERFLLDSGLERLEPKGLDVRRLGSVLGTGGAGVRVGADLVANSGRWVKLTAESAEAVKRHGLMPTTTPGVSHAMIGKRGDIGQWLQIVKGPAPLLGGPMALAALSTMMQQQAMQQQIDQIVEYLQEINEKVDDILRGQKDSILADLIGVDLMVEEALTVRQHVGSVSEVTWSKVQATSSTIARTQAYAVRQLDAIADKLEKTRDLGDITRMIEKAEPQVREWLAVLARTFQLQESVAVLELDRVLEISPDELDRHRLGLAAARGNRRDLLARSTERILIQMSGTISLANSKVFFNPFDSPRAVRSSDQLASGVVSFRQLLGIDSERDAVDAKRWKQAAAEVFERARASGAEGTAAVKRLGAESVERATSVFHAVDIDGDGVPDQPRAAAAAQQAGAAIKGAATSVGGAIGGLFRRKTAAEREGEKPQDADPEDLKE